MIGFMIIGGIVSSKLKNKVKKYSAINTTSGMSGKEIAERMLSDNGIIAIEISDYLIKPLREIVLKEGLIIKNIVKDYSGKKRVMIIK